MNTVIAILAVISMGYAFCSFILSEFDILVYRLLIVPILMLNLFLVLIVIGFGDIFELMQTHFSYALLGFSLGLFEAFFFEDDPSPVRFDGIWDKWLGAIMPRKDLSADLIALSLIRSVYGADYETLNLKGFQTRLGIDDEAFAALEAKLITRPGRLVQYLSPLKAAELSYMTDMVLKVWGESSNPRDKKYLRSLMVLVTRAGMSVSLFNAKLTAMGIDSLWSSGQDDKSREHFDAYNQAGSNRSERQKYMALFNLGSNASLDDLKKAYRRLAVKHHPDRNPSGAEQAHEKMSELNQAYDWLVDNW